MDPNNQQPILPTPAPVSPIEPFEPASSNKTKKIVIIGAIVIVVILSIVAIVASLSGGGDKKKDAAQTTQTSELTRNPSAIDIENINNSINSSITGLDDEKDFPEANLDDKSLEL